MKEIESIELLYPEVMAADADEVILGYLKSLQEKKDEKAALFAKQVEVDKEIAEITDKIDALSSLFRANYKKEEAPEEKPIGEAPVVVESTGIIHA